MEAVATTYPGARTPSTSQEALDALLLEVLPVQECSRRPPQGAWRDDDYLELTDHCNRFIELTDAAPENRLHLMPRGCVRSAHRGR